MERDAAAVRRVKSSGSHDSGSRRNDCTPETRGRDGGDGDEKKRRQQQGRAGAGTGASCLREELTLVLLAGFACALWALTRASLQQLLVGHNTEFNALRARKHLEQITSVGPRPVGSVENEVLTVNYLLEQVEQIRTASAGGHHAITVDVQRPTGSFSIDFLGGFTSYYDRVTNVAVRLEPKAGAEHLVLANCHFDSVANSPGASDDAVSCAIMLEVLRSLANVSTPLTHGVVFLFNGAEENVLQASHGFITQHPWAKQVRTFVNLEAAGVGGKEVVFQTGPENPWLVQAYVHAAKHPFASVVGQEVFQSGIIPSDTDFRIYRDFGNIPGIDLAFIENGFIYHTRYDTSNRIMTESIQRAGDNILSLLKHLLTSDMLADASEYRHGNMVFFDVLGVLMVAYPARVGSILNYMTVAAVCLYLAKKCSRTSRAGARYVRALACACCVALLGWFVTLLFVLIIAVLLTLMGVSMFWYTHFYAAVLLYGSAAVGKMLLIHTLAKNLYYGSVHRLELAEMFFDVSLVLWCCVLLFFTLRGLCSAYVPMLMVAFPLVTKLLLSFQVTHTGVSLPYAVFYLSGLTLPYLHLSFLIWVVFEIFTPILGRSGTEIPPDVVLASLVTLATVILSSYLLHLVYLASGTRRVLTMLLSVFLLMLFLVSCGLFFPYSADPSSPRPKRVIIQHTTRVFHALDGSVQHSDSGFWINSFDYTAMRHVTPHVPEINDSARSHCRDDVPFCGFPWFLPVKFLIKKNWYVAAPAVSPKSPVEFRLASRQVTEWGTLKLSFEAAGPSHMSLYVLPSPGVSLTSWSFGDGSPQYDLNGEYFVFYSHGLEAPTWKFWLEFQPPPEQSDEDGVASVAVASHYFFGDERRTPDLELLLHKLPDWTFPSSWVSTYHLYRY